MTAQVRKKQIWCTCDSCGVQTLVDDVSLHLKTCCPPSECNWTHEFINMSVLHGWIAENGDSDDSILKSLHRVYLSAEVLQQCQICFGEPLIVTVSNKPYIKRAWISSSKKLTSICMPKRVLEAVWGTNNGEATVEKLTTPPLPAEKIIVSLKSTDEELFNQANVPAYLHKLYFGQIIFNGQELLLPYFGKDILFYVNSVVPVSPSKSYTELSTIVPEELKRVSRGAHQYKSRESRRDKTAHDPKKLTVKLRGDEKCFPDSQFYIVVAHTQWLISSPEQNERTDLLDTLGGLTNIVEKLRKIIAMALDEKVPQKTHVVRGVILHGPPGTGKTLLARAVAQETNADFYELKYDELYSKLLGETESRLRAFFSQVRSSSCAVVLLDRIHCLCPRASTSSDVTDLERRILNLLQVSLSELGSSGCHFVVLATTNDPDSIAPSLRRLGRLEIEVEIPVPSPDARFEILMKLLNGTPHELTHEDIVSLSKSAHGFVGADLAALVSSACAVMLEMGNQTLNINHLKIARMKVHPSAMREILINVPNVRWSDIGGQEDLKMKLRQVVEWPLSHPESFARLGIQQPRGILMFGPPGCSKTMVAKALASESKINFLSIKGPELFNKWLGESERAVRAVFRRARQVAPAIIFFDEIDALGGERSSDSGSNSNVEDRVLSQLLVEMNGIELLENVFIVAATNRPDLIDKALLRPGRLDHKVYVPLPDADTRRQILTIQMKKMPVGLVDQDDLVEATEGYSGAEIVAVCHEAALIALSPNLDCKIVEPEHFKSALSVVSPRTSQPLLQMFSDFIK